MPENIEYDIITIGTSPISIINSLLEYKKNKKILILDKSKHFGGNWHVQKIYGYDNVEIAPHYIKVKEENFKIFDMMDISYDINSFIPKYLLPEPILNINKVERFYIKHIENFNHDRKLYRIILNLLKIILLFIKNKLTIRAKPRFFYPKGGCGNLLQKLKSKLIELRIENINDVNVLKIFENKSGIIIIDTNKGRFSTKKCFISSGFKKIKIYKHRKIINKTFVKEQKNYHVIVVVNEKPSKHPFYFSALNHHLIRSISDVSHYSEYYKMKKNNERILAIRLSEINLVDENKTFKSDIENWLKEVKIIKHKSQIIYLKHFSFPMLVRRENEIAKLNRSSPKNVKFIYSFDMGVALHYLKR